MMHHMSAVTLAVRAMPEAITFYTQLGFTLVYGGPQAQFSTLQAGDALINLTLAPHFKPTWWGRTMFRVDNVDSLYQTAVAQRLTPSAPQNGESGLFTSQIPMGMISALRNPSPQQQPKSLCAAQRIRAASDGTERIIMDTRRRKAFGDSYAKDACAPVQAGGGSDSHFCVT
jgi:glyoxalase/bleomycin resistance protein/dioxygenase superfamily protein